MARHRRGSVYFDDARGHWIAEVQIHGKPYRRIGATASEAHERLEREVLAPHAISGAVPTRMTVATFAEIWLGEIRPHHAKSQETLETERTIIEGQVLPAIGHIPLRDLTIDDVQHMLNRARNKRTGKALSAAYAAKVRGSLSRMLRDAERRGYVQRDVAAHAATPVSALRRTKDERRRALTPAEIVRLFAECATDAHGNYFVVCYELALRPGEAASLRRGDVDLGRGVVHVVTARNGRDGTAKVGRTKNQASRRSLRLTDRAASALEVALAENPDGGAGGLVFATRSGRMLSASNMRRSLERLCVAAKVPKICPYELRHARITHLCDNGAARVEDVATFVGHSDTRMIRSTYWHSEAVIEIPGAA
jgi:integrase